MSWNDEQEKAREPKYRNEYMTLGPYRFPHERDRACNRLCASGDWYMHSSDVQRGTGHYFAVMGRAVKIEGP